MSTPQPSFPITYSRALFSALRRANDNWYVRGYFEKVADELGSTEDATPAYVAETLQRVRVETDRELGTLKRASRRPMLDAAEATVARTVAPNEIAAEILTALAMSRLPEGRTFIVDEGPGAGRSLGRPSGL